MKKGRLALFCGAGISNDFPTCLPLFPELKNEVIDTMIELTDRQQIAFKKDDIELLKNRPLPPEFIMQQIYKYWGKLAIYITDLFMNFGSKKIESNDDHKIISALTKHGLHIILTTNFDRIIENELGVEQVEGNSAIKALTVNIRSDQPLEKLVVVKLHGSAGNHQEITLTLNQVGRPHIEKQRLLSSLLERYVVLFLGYGGRDLDLFPDILRTATKAKGIYWTFHNTESRSKEADIEKQLRVYGSKFHPIECDATDLLRKLLPEDEQKKFPRKDGKCNEAEKRWTKQIRKLFQEGKQQINIQRVYLIFADLATHLNEWDATRRFLKTSWQVYKKDNDKYGMAITALKFSTLYKNMSAVSLSKAFNRKSVLWLEKATEYAVLTKDDYINGEVALHKGIHAYERIPTSDRQQAIKSFENEWQQVIKVFEKAEKHFEKLGELSNEKSDLVDETLQREHSLEQMYIDKDQLLGRTYMYIGRCYLDSSFDHQMQQIDKKVADQAINYLLKASKRFDNIGALDELAEAEYLLGKGFESIKKYEKAERAFGLALEIRNAIHHPQGQTQAHRELDTSTDRDTSKNKETFEPHDFNNYHSYFEDVQFCVPHFLVCILSGISLAMFFTFVFLTSINLALNRLWGVLVGCLFIIIATYSLRGRVGKYSVDIVANLGALFLVSILTADVEWFYQINERVYKNYEMVIVAILGLGLLIALNELKKARAINLLQQLEISGPSGEEFFSQGTIEERLVFDLNIRDAATVIYHFFRDPRPWLFQLVMSYINPDHVSTENNFSIQAKMLWVRHKTIMGTLVDVETLRFIRINRNKYIVRIGTDSKEWYVYAVQRYSDFRRAVYRTGSESR